MRETKRAVRQRTSEPNRTMYVVGEGNDDNKILTFSRYTGIVVDDLTSVSYTHLDVYKRQLLILTLLITFTPYLSLTFGFFIVLHTIDSQSVNNFMF